jgi:hypothetical protein
MIFLYVIHMLTFGYEFCIFVFHVSALLYEESLIT